MTQVISTLLSHYRRHPGQLIMLLLGLWVASALWSGIQAINATARDSYARADALFATQLDQLERRDGAHSPAPSITPCAKQACLFRLCSRVKSLARMAPGLR